MSLQHFQSLSTLLEFTLQTVVQEMDLQLERMQKSDHEHYTDEDRATIQAQIHDLRAAQRLFDDMGRLLDTACSLDIKNSSVQIPDDLREKLIEVCSDDVAGVVKSSNGALYSHLENGFEGFRARSDAELVAYFHDAELYEDEPDLAVELAKRGLLSVNEPRETTQ